MTIIEIKHLDSNRNCLWSVENLGNTWHRQGQQFILMNSFWTPSQLSSSPVYNGVPNNYYVGLDNRSSISEDDTLATNIGSSAEPSGNGYVRYALSSTTGFSVGLNYDYNIVATSGVCTFTAGVGAWQTVNNVFLASTNDNSGYLIASSVFAPSGRILQPGETITAQLNLSFSTC